MILPAIALGKFDALHRGHQALAARASQSIGSAALLSFTGMAEVLGWPPRRPLVAPSDRARVLAQWSAQLGAAVAEHTLPFATIRPLSAADFLALIQERFATRLVVVGEDFRAGLGRSAGVVELAQLADALGMQVQVVPAVHDGAGAISSSAIRSDLMGGRIEAVTRALGRPYRLVGRVVRGDGRGRQIGVPTANCGERENEDPGSGVYAAIATLPEGSYPAAVNVGHAPTIASDRPLTVEAHLIGYQGECYGSRLTLDFRVRLREERRFASLDELKQQLVEDVRAAAAAAATAMSG